jgi:hypothetical protein
MLASDLDPISQDTSWITELVNVMREVAEGRIPRRIEATFAGAKGGAGKQFRPRLTSIKRKDSSIESFHISFIEVLERGMAGGEPAGMRSLQTALRLAYRLRWEILNVIKIGISSTTKTYEQYTTFSNDWNVRHTFTGCLIEAFCVISLDLMHMLWMQCTVNGRRSTMLREPVCWIKGFPKKRTKS